MTLREDANIVIQDAINAVLPDAAVKAALEKKTFPDGRKYIISIGKAAWQMANAAVSILKDYETGIVITKYDHVKAPIERLTCFEAGHPVPDENSFNATQAAIDLVKDLHKNDTVLFLVSGGGSALFEKPLVSAEELQDVTRQLLACGADIVEINTIRKRLSAVKGGKFADLCKPAQIYSIVLSDIIGDSLDMIASGPAYPDSSTCAQAKAIVKKYGIVLSEHARACLEVETPKECNNVETIITGSVRNLCNAAADSARKLGYKPIILTDQLSCIAREAGSFLASIAKSNQSTAESLAFIAGGETIVHLTGTGLGGRNQEIALSAAEGLGSLKNTALFSIGSDGTDGPTDAAGGFVDGTTKEKLKAVNIDIFDTLNNNDAYHALQIVDGLIITGPTGTNVNDVSVLLIKR